MINTILGILFFLVAITIIVVVHEWGHLIVAKRNGVKCFEFSIGMGPKIFTFYTDKDGTVYNIRWIPLGGYVMMAGEEEAKIMEFDKEQSLNNKHPWQKIKILFAGAIMNFILGWTVLFISFFAFGTTRVSDTNVVNVSPDSPASAAGLQSGDTITSVDGVEVTSYSEITTNLANKQSVEITFEHDGTTKTKQIEKVQLDCSTSVIGIQGTTEKNKFDLVNSFKSASLTFVAIAKSIGQSLQLLFSGTAGVTDLMGPIGIASASKSVVTQGISIMLMTIAFLSINIGFVNILPFPALDGGRIILAFIELITKRKVPEKFEMYLNLIGFILLMALFVVVTFSDVGRLGTEQYYNMGITSDTVCAAEAEEVNYKLNLSPINEKLPETVNVELKVSDGIITEVKDSTDSMANDSDVVEFEYDGEAVNQISNQDITITVDPESKTQSPLDMTIKVYDEKGDTINQGIYRIERK